MQTKESIEIDCRLGVPGCRFRDRDRRPQIVVSAFAKRHDHVQAINRAALKNRNQRLAPAAGYPFASLAKHRALKK